jgi:hypothetical protein
MRAFFVFCLLSGAIGFIPTTNIHHKSSLNAKKGKKGFGSSPPEVTRKEKSPEMDVKGFEVNTNPTIDGSPTERLKNTGAMRLAELEAKRASRKINVLEVGILVWLMQRAPRSCT